MTSIFFQQCEIANNQFAHQKPLLSTEKTLQTSIPKVHAAQENVHQYVQEIENLRKQVRYSP